MSEQRHLLIVDTDPGGEPNVANALQRDGFLVTLTSSHKAMFELLNTEKIALILLDVGLRDHDGLTLIRQIRARSPVPIVAVAERTDDAECAAALEAGADDCVTLPVEPDEAVEHIRTVLARQNGAAAPENLPIGPMTLDVRAATLRCPDGMDVTLTHAECNLLVALARAPGEVHSRGQLLDAISRDTVAPAERLIDVMVSRLRKKIEADPRKPEIIQTVIGEGYRFVPPGH